MSLFPTGVTADDCEGMYQGREILTTEKKNVVLKIGDKVRMLEDCYYDHFQKDEILTVDTLVNDYGHEITGFYCVENKKKGEGQVFVGVKEDKFEVLDVSLIGLYDPIPAPITPEKSIDLKVIQSEQIAMYDCDDTLVMWDQPIKDVYVMDPHTGKQEALSRHELHIKYLKQHKSRGFTNIVWSAGGYAWAKAVVDALELNDYVDLIMSKPVKYFDDLPAEEVLVNRVYLDYKYSDKKVDNQE